MGHQTIAIGDADARDGESLRSAGDKINEMFAELDSAVSAATTTQFYVATTGNDANDGLTVGTPFLTIQKAVLTASLSLGLVDQSIIIDIADGTYTLTAPVLIGPIPTRGTLTLRGNTVTPANVLITSSGFACFRVVGSTYAIFTGMELRAPGAGGVCIESASYAFTLMTAAMVYGPSAGGIHMKVVDHGVMQSTTAYTITGGALAHFWVDGVSSLRLAAATTLTGTPAFSTAFGVATMLGTAVITGSSYSGSATGSRYQAIRRGCIISGGLTLPGNAAGTTGSGGLFS